MYASSLIYFSDTSDEENIEENEGPAYIFISHDVIIRTSKGQEGETKLHYKHPNIHQTCKGSIKFKKKSLTK